MPRALADLVALIDHDLDIPPLRRATRDASIAAATDLLSRIPWIHRTGKDADAVPEILRAGLLRPRAVATTAETQLEIEASVYFYLGAACYPYGWLVLWFQPQAINAADVFTPFDSGALARPHFDCPVESHWDELAHRVARLRAHEGGAADALQFASQYVAAHFHAPAEYVRRDSGDTDFPVFHGLQSASGDRRAWTIEARAARNVSLDECARFFSLEDRQEDLPTEILARTSLVRDDGSATDPLRDAVTRAILDAIRLAA